jgi:hypothetical protein
VRLYWPQAALSKLHFAVSTRRAVCEQAQIQQMSSCQAMAMHFDPAKTQGSDRLLDI